MKLESGRMIESQRCQQLRGGRSERWPGAAERRSSPAAELHSAVELCSVRAVKQQCGIGASERCRGGVGGNLERTPPRSCGVLDQRGGAVEPRSAVESWSLEMRGAS